MNNQGIELAKTARIIITVSKTGSGAETDPIKKNRPVLDTGRKINYHGGL